MWNCQFFLDADIPGLANNCERSLDFVTSEVRSQLAYLPPEQVDEILILLGGFESTVSAEHLHKLNAVLETLRAHEILIKGSKTEFFRFEVEFLGFQLSKDGWTPTESKVAAILEWPAPETVKHLRSFLGMAKFFRIFIPLYSDMSSPLTELLKDTKGARQTLQWSMACDSLRESQNSFDVSASPPAL